MSKKDQENFEVEKFDIRKLSQYKSQLLEKTKNQIVSYSDFVRQANDESSSKIIKMLKKNAMKSVLKRLQEAKEDYDAKKLSMTFNVSGSKNLRFGGKINREDTYIIDSKDILSASVIEYFNDEAPLKTKDKEVKERFESELKEFSKQVVDFGKYSFTFETVNVKISVDPADQFYDIGGANGAKIDLSK